jgi:hypothetical protein
MATFKYYRDTPAGVIEFDAMRYEVTAVDKLGLRHWPELRHIDPETTYEQDGFYFFGKHDGQWMTISRVIERKSNPSMHECSAKCVGGSIHGRCECRCGGKNHGIGAARQG